jgi:SDR family mycofactocin-dependent oxidoreductase
MTNGRFTGKVALVTGAARGMGRAHAVRLASEGADIIMCDIARDFDVTPYPGSTLEDLRETKRLVTALGRGCVSEPVDVRDFEALEHLVQGGVDELGGLDVVVANAGINSAGRAWELSEEEFDEVISVNLKGVWHTAKAAIPTMIARGNGGVIVMTGSTSAVKGLPFMAHYSATKHGVVGLVKTLAVELGQYNIRVIAVHPGATRTGLTSPPMHQLVAENPRTASVFDNTLPVELMEAEDVAAAVAFLASDEARYMTGSEVRVDMGNLCR